MEIHEQLAARRFVLADEEGNPTAYITGAEVGFLGFHVEGPEKGKPVVSIGIQAETGLPIIKMDSPGGGFVMIAVTASGKASIYLADADGTERVIATT